MTLLLRIYRHPTEGLKFGATGETMSRSVSQHELDLLNVLFTTFTHPEQAGATYVLLNVCQVPQLRAAARRAAGCAAGAGGAHVLHRIVAPGAAPPGELP